jgi:hypothetical protein
LGLSFTIVGLGHVVVTCDGAILRVNAPVFVDVFLATAIMGDEEHQKKHFSMSLGQMFLCPLSASP